MSRGKEFLGAVQNKLRLRLVTELALCICLPLSLLTLFFKTSAWLQLLVSASIILTTALFLYIFFKGLKNLSIEAIAKQTDRQLNSDDRFQTIVAPIHANSAALKFVENQTTSYVSADTYQSLTPGRPSTLSILSASLGVIILILSFLLNSPSESNFANKLSEIANEISSDKPELKEKIESLANDLEEGLISEGDVLEALESYEDISKELEEAKKTPTNPEPETSESQGKSEEDQGSSEQQSQNGDPSEGNGDGRKQSQDGNKGEQQSESNEQQSKSDGQSEGNGDGQQQSQDGSKGEQQSGSNEQQSKSDANQSTGENNQQSGESSESNTEKQESGSSEQSKSDQPSDSSGKNSSEEKGQTSDSSNSSKSSKEKQESTENNEQNGKSSEGKSEVTSDENSSKKAPKASDSETGEKQLKKQEGKEIYDNYKTEEQEADQRNIDKSLLEDSGETVLNSEPFEPTTQLDNTDFSIEINSKTNQKQSIPREYQDVIR